MSGASSLRLQRLVGGAFVAVMVAVHIAWMGRATIVVSVGLVVAYLVWLGRASSPLPAAARVLGPYLAGIVIMGLHCAEEYFTGFQRQFPTFFGYQWTDGQFLRGL